MRSRRLVRRVAGAIVLAAFASATAIVGTAAPAASAGPETSTTLHAGVAVSGPLDDKPGEYFGGLVEGSSSEGDDGATEPAASADFFFGDVECFTEAHDVVFDVAEDLGHATLTGTASGQCWDIGREQGSEYTATIALEWTAVGRTEAQRFGSVSPDGYACRTTVKWREATATGTVEYSAPQLGLSGVAAPYGHARIEQFTDSCVETRRPT